MLLCGGRDECGGCASLVVARDQVRRDIVGGLVVKDWGIGIPHVQHQRIAIVLGVLLDEDEKLLSQSDDELLFLSRYRLLSVLLVAVELLLLVRQILLELRSGI